MVGDSAAVAAVRAVCKSRGVKRRELLDGRVGYRHSE